MRKMDELTKAVMDYVKQLQSNMRQRPFWPGMEKLVEVAQMSGWGPPGMAGYRSVNPIIQHELPGLLRMMENPAARKDAIWEMLFRPDFQAGLVNEGFAQLGVVRPPGLTFIRATKDIMPSRDAQRLLQQQLGPMYQRWPEGQWPE